MMNSFQYPSGATPLDPDDMYGLKIKHITTRQELDRWEQDNINDALQWLVERRKADILTEVFIKTLHQKMFGKVWKWAGTFRKSGKNIGVDWPQIAVSIHALLHDVRYWIDNKTYRDDEIAVRLHHRLVFIHPFTNGNGRHARLMADVLLDEVFYKEPFSWNIPGVDDPDEVRKKYLLALRAADKNNYSALLAFVNR
jgi:Fic-DOC domain mobile mystery protein B